MRNQRTSNQIHTSNSVDDYKAFSRNYYALYVSIVKKKTGKQSLRALGLLAE